MRERRCTTNLARALMNFYYIKRTKQAHLLVGKIPLSVGTFPMVTFVISPEEYSCKYSD